MRAFLKSRKGRILAAIFFALVGVIALFPHTVPALGATSGTFDNAQAIKNFAAWAGGFFKFFQWGVAVTAFVLAMYNAFEAARGEGGKWKNVVLLVIVAIVVLAPGQIAGMLGMNQIKECVLVLTSKGTQGNPDTCAGD